MIIAFSCAVGRFWLSISIGSNEMENRKEGHTWEIRQKVDAISGLLIVNPL